MRIEANLLDIFNRTSIPAEIDILNGKIQKITPTQKQYQHYIMPGFVDAHVHIESSMLVPSEFAKVAVKHGTVATISDPHEIANVLGIAGVEYMIENGKTVPFKFYFGAPSCVPATVFETAGAEISPQDIRHLLMRPEVKYLAEMMNWVGVLHHDALVHEKIKIAQELGKVIDGHAPGLRGEQAAQYIQAGMSTDHECFTAAEALDKLKHGMNILIREGSAAKNFEALIDLIDEYAPLLMFCSDDKHPDNLVEGHINLLVKRALKKGKNIFDVLQVACVNPVLHYKLEVGLLREGDAADFILVNNLEDFEVLQTYIDGKLVAENQHSYIQTKTPSLCNNFMISPITKEDLKIKPLSKKIQVIEALDGELITNSIFADARIDNENIVSDTENDILKFVVVNRYAQNPVAIAFIKNFNLKEGAIASSVGHDSHNILAVGADDESITKAINAVIRHRGGVSAVSAKEENVLPLPIAGLMSDKDGETVAKLYSEIDLFAKKELGSTLTSPFMTLSFMALLVIPALKLSDKGLFDGQKFQFSSVFPSNL